MNRYDTYGLILQIFIIFITVFIFCSTAYAPFFEKYKKEITNEELSHTGLKKIQFFSKIILIFTTENEVKIGLNKKKLNEFLKLRYKNNFSNFPYKQLNENEFSNFALSEGENEIREFLGVIIVKIFTVGSDYPIAYHINLSAGNLSQTLFEAEYLGIDSADTIEKAIKNSIRQLVESLANDFFKARSKR